MKTILNLIVSIVLVFNNAVFAEIITDGTVGNTFFKGTVHTLPFNANKKLTITENVGTIQNDNLFHSFNTFNIGKGETVIFKGTSELKNVFTKVTGGEISTLNGLLKSKVGTANFYFINPAGVIFGKNAIIDVPASFHVSTADILQFKDNIQLDTGKPMASTLSIAEPESFGFLGTSTGKIEVNGSKSIGTTLAVKTGQTLDLVAGDILIKRASLSANSGDIRLIAIQGKESVTLTKNTDGILALPTITPTITNAGNISINNNSKITTQGNGGGRIGIWGGNNDYTKSAITANNQGAEDASLKKAIEIHAYTLNLNNTVVSFDAEKSGKSGDVNIESDTLNIIDGGHIGTTSSSTGNSGNVKITANTLLINNQKTDPILTGIYSTNTGNGGDSGNVTVNTEKLMIFSGGSIASSTYSQGNAANVEITADTIKIDPQFSLQTTGIFSDAKVGATTRVTGNAGNVIVNTKTLNIQNGGQISSSSHTHGKAGDITLNIENLNVFNQAQISTSADKISEGNGGTITIDNAKLINLQNSNLLTTVKNPNGNGGNINLTSDVLLINTGAIQANAEGGNGGNINLNLKALIPSQEFLINGGSLVEWNKSNFNVVQASSATGINGNINITSPKFDISGAIKILTSTITLPTLNFDPCQNQYESSLSRGNKGILLFDYFVSPITSEKLDHTIISNTNENSFIPSYATQQPCKLSAL